MSVKQDRTAPRTATDLERKYSFGKTFSEIIGLIDDTRKDVDAVESGLLNEITEQSTSIRRDTEQIVFEAKATIDGELEDIKKEVKTKVDSDGLSVAVKREVSGGIALETGYTFDADGLRIHKTGEEMDNTLDNTGMYVKRGDEPILTANKDGVVALDLHAKTFLKVGSGDGRSRFEDYGTNRIGCFWTGG